jgi:hypothetical protein
MSNKGDSPFKYLPYVTLREGWSRAKSMFFAWIVSSAIFMAFIAMTEFGVKSAEEYWSLLPKPVWAMIGFAVFSWILRDEELRLTLPQSFQGWLLLNLGFALGGLVSSFLPAWALVPFCFGFIGFFAVLDDLAAVGKRNYDQLSGPGGGV